MPSQLNIATVQALEQFNISSKDDMDNRGGPTTSGLYDRIRELTPPDAWNQIRDPKASIRFYYQMKLPGYAIYKG